MKINSKEMKALIIVGSILVGILFWQFGYNKLNDKLKETKQARAVVEDKYNKAMSDIQTLEDRKTKVKVLSTKSVDMASGFYPTILQAKIILEINEIMQESGIKGDLNFAPIEVKEVEDITPNTPRLPNSSFQGIVDIINEKVSETSGKNSVGGVQATTVSGVTCEQFKVVLSITDTSKESWLKLLTNLEKYDRRIVLNTLNLSVLSEDVVSTILNIEFYGVPKVNNVDAAYLEWDVNKVNTSNGLTFTDGVLINNSERKSDFIALLKPLASEFTTFRMGRTNDNTFESYMYDDRKEPSEVVLELTEKEGVFYYKYKTGNTSIPVSGSSEGAKFTPNGEDIVFDIFSEARVGIEDVSGIKLKVINNTTKKVNVVIDGDDAAKPRVDFTSEGGTVNVIR